MIFRKWWFLKRVFQKSETRVQDLTIKFRILSCSETLRKKVINLSQVQDGWTVPFLKDWLNQFGSHYELSDDDTIELCRKPELSTIVRYWEVSQISQCKTQPSNGIGSFKRDLLFFISKKSIDSERYSKNFEKQFV